MKSLPAALIYVAFYGMIVGAVYFTKSGWPLFALLFTLLFTPSVTTKTSSKD